ncbi:MAG: hypothetical protein KDC39_07290 [Actinobacteria bacterium]|nr:hypothetical protein [Actinomycetota bacterium]
MPQFLLSVWHDDSYETDFSGSDAQRRVAQVSDFNAALVEGGHFLFAGGLHPKHTATVARWSNGSVAVSTGSYDNGAEQMGGFWIIEAPDRAAAQEWAQRAATACEGPVELRELQGGA